MSAAPTRSKRRGGPVRTSSRAPSRMQTIATAREREVDEEDQPPRGRPRRCSPPSGGPTIVASAVARGPDPDRAPGLLLVERPDQREAVRRDERGRDPLEGARGDQLLDVLREPGERRGERRRRRPPREDAPPAEAVAERAGDEVERDERERVGERDPLLAGEAEVEPLADRRQRERDDERVQERERRSEDRCDED